MLIIKHTLIRSEFFCCSNNKPGGGKHPLFGSLRIEDFKEHSFRFQEEGQ